MSHLSNYRRASWSRRVVWAATGAAIFLVACSPSSEPAGDVGAGTAPGPAVEVAIADSEFNPEIIRVPAGQEVTVQVMNDDGAPHDFAIEDLELNTGTIGPDETAHATFTAPSQPTIFICTFHPGMEGRIEPR